MTSLEAELKPVLVFQRKSKKKIPDQIAGYDTPNGLKAILSFADGFVTKDSAFRVFGLHNDDILPGLTEHNASEWKQRYRELAQENLFIAEDLFGDQYGYRLKNGKNEFVKFYCEGGRIEPVPGGINHFIEAMISPTKSGIIDWGMVIAAFALGKRPNAGQHLAFQIPLIMGGDYDAQNIEIESRALHLGTLSQLTQELLKHPNQSKIKGVRSQ